MDKVKDNKKDMSEMEIVEILKPCKGSCCPTIIINSAEKTITVTDDYGGKVEFSEIGWNQVVDSWEKNQWQQNISFIITLDDVPFRLKHESETISIICGYKDAVVIPIHQWQELIDAWIAKRNDVI